jgi:probable rRNA maturation factor
LDCPEAEISILIVDDQQIAQLNHQYLNREGPTNVIAFPMRQGPFSDIAPNLLGDVVISADTAQREAKSAGISMQDRFDQLLIHGTLHLLGYDHEYSAAEASKMEEKAKELLQLLECKEKQHF